MDFRTWVRLPPPPPNKKNIDKMIVLPVNLFYGTIIPTTILVFKKNRQSKDILFVDASNDYEKGKNQNNLRERPYQ